MPFNKQTAYAAGSKGGMKRFKEPSAVRNKQLKITVSENERNEITSKANEAGLSLVELILNSVKTYTPNA